MIIKEAYNFGMKNASIIKYVLIKADKRKVNYTKLWPLLMFKT